MTISLEEIITIVSDQLGGNNDNRPDPKIITANTKLVEDLNFTSVEFVVIFEKIQQLQSTRINFIDLIMPDRSNYVDDLSIAQINAFIRNSSPSINQDRPLDTYVSKREEIHQSDIDLLNKTIQHQIYPTEVVDTKTSLCFVLSAPRSGSTLLRRMLGCHPDIYAPMELHLMAYQNFAQRHQELSNTEHRHLLEGTVVARQEIRNMKREVSIAVEQMYVRDRRSISQFFKEIDPHLKQQIIIDKTPTYSFSEATLRRIKHMFPNSKFIHLTRTPNAVVKSIIDSDLGQLIKFNQTSGIKPTRFAEALWCLCEQNIKTVFGSSANQERLININYEDLVKAPQTTMHKLHHFLNITISDEINPYTSEQSDNEEQVGNYAGDLKTFLRSSIDSKVADEWQRFDSLQWLSKPTKLLLAGE